MDFELTDDGDLYLGQQQVDDEGYLLYYQISGRDGEIPRITKDIEEASIPIRDFKTITGEEEKVQLIGTRLRTDNPDFVLYENVGASLSDFVGEINNENTAEEIEIRVMNTLLRESNFKEEDLSVNVLPVSPTEVLTDVQLKNKNEYIRYAFSLNFDIGIVNTFVLDRNGNIIEDEEKINPDIYSGILTDEEREVLEEVNE